MPGCIIGLQLQQQHEVKTYQCCTLPCYSPAKPCLSRKASEGGCMYILRRRTLDWINTHLTVWEGNVELHGSLLYRINNFFLILSGLHRAGKRTLC